MQKSMLGRATSLERLGLDADRLASMSRAAISISESLQVLKGAGLQQSLRAFEEWQGTMASTLKPFEDMQGGGGLLANSSLLRGLQIPNELMVNWESRFGLSGIGTIGKLLADAHESPWSGAIAAAMPRTPRLQDAFAEMTKPWINMQESLRSVAALAELHGIGRVLSEMPAFGDALTGALRMDLGDWRDSISWPSEVLADVDLRGGFYADLGFNRDLTAFPPEAFDEGLDISGVRGERPALIVRYEGPVPAADDAEEEAGVARTNMAHDWLLRLETQLRAFISQQMTRAVGADWAQRRLPNGMYEQWQDKRRRANQAGAAERPLIAYADFTDYMNIICRRDNWREVFAVFFGRQESVRESFQRLYPIRLDTMHARIIAQDDQLLLYVETRRLMKMVAGD